MLPICAIDQSTEYAVIDGVLAVTRGTQFTVHGSGLSRNRILGTRPMFDLPWSAEFRVEYDPELVDEDTTG